MLEIKNLSKVYKPKKGLPVTALKNISLEFPEKGLIFLIGKSGSGKSTLLNLIGGLDGYSSGEIIIKGKSSKNFKTSDFDSYRNTFIGFVFQEFNILEDYSVGQNIALALELQHKKADRAAIETVMNTVDLDKVYFDRRINELSGGQKQRVAIARALIKNPDIIMADEPTGALDSKTGEQVFETLKKLSLEKLVIVVSHDRENAQLFGDRIIELADGEIIDDRTREKNTSSFIKTENENIEKIKNEDFALVKSRLPFKDSLKMGATSLLVKKLRLAFTILLSFIAFTVFGLTSTLATYNLYKTEIETVKMKGQNTILVSSTLFNPDNSNNNPGNGLTKEQIAEIERISGNKTLKLFYNDKERFSYEIFAIENFKKAPTAIYYANHLSNFLEVANESDANLTAVATGSRLPIEGNNDEIAISDWVADSLIENGLRSDKDIKSYEDLLGQTIKLKEGSLYLEMKITGVYKTDVDKEDYASYKEKSQVNSIDESILRSLDKMIISMGYVAPNFIPINSNALAYIPLANWKTRINNVNSNVYSAYSISKLTDENVYLGGRELSSLQADEIIVSPYLLNNGNSFNWETIKVYFDGLSEQDRQITLYNNLIVVGTYKIAGIIMDSNSSSTMYLSESVYDVVKTSEEQSDILGINGYYGISSKEGGQYNNNLSTIWKASNYDLSSLDIYWGKNGIPKNKLEDNEIILTKSGMFGYVNYSSQWSDEDFYYAFDNMGKNIMFGLLNYEYATNSYKVINGKELKVVGMYWDDGYRTSLLGDEAFAFVEDLNNSPTAVMVKLSDNWNKNKELFDYLKSTEFVDNNIIVTMKIYTSATEMLDGVALYANELVDICFYVAIGLSVFAGLLLMNFIGVSIQNKKKEIGILRAIGARSIDVFKIFLCEGLIIGAINFVLSYLAVVIVSLVMNNLLSVSVFVPGIIHALLMLALSIGVVLISTFIPIYKIAKKKPIDAINNR